MFFLFLGLNTLYVVAFRDVIKNGNAEERFSFDGYFDRIEHGGYHGHKSHKGTWKGHSVMWNFMSSPCSLVIVSVIHLHQQTIYTIYQPHKITVLTLLLEETLVKYFIF